MSWTDCRVSRTVGLHAAYHADHGNADQMYDTQKDGSVRVRTAHSLNPVPFILCGGGALRQDAAFGLANVAPTIAALLGIPAPKSWHESMLV